MFTRILIRTFEILFIFLIIIFFSPFFMLIIILQIIFNGMPILYVDYRYGINLNKIALYKLRSMTTNLNLPENRRITWFGKILRKSSIDELPQLYNVLNGDMSLIGPRPINQNTLNYFKKNYPEKLILRQSVKPGISGYTQLLFDGSKRTWDEKIALDLKFVSNFSIKLYFKILILTIPYIFKKYYYNKTGETL